MKKPQLKQIIKEVLSNIRHDSIKKEMKILEKNGRLILKNIEKISKEEFGI